MKWCFNLAQTVCLCLFVFIWSISYLQTVECIPNYRVLVSTRYGQVEGISYPSQYTDLPQLWINAYLGVPYTKTLAQYGEEWKEKFRFRNPDEEPFWYTTLDASKHKPACPQMPWLVKETVPNFSQISEDCLYLDIYAPNKTDETQTPNPSLYPVLVFLHGGGFIMGTSKQWPGNFIAERNVVVVVINYRLNALGFFSTGDRYSPGNYGMMDQVQALKFIKSTIRSFRGNPNQITLMGQSAGAASVGLHLLSPRSRNLFQQAVMLSGSELSEWAVISSSDAKVYAKRLCERVGCPYSDSQQMVDCLRYSRTFEDIVNASAMIPMMRGKIGNPWGPVVDGPIVGVDYAFLPEPPQDLRLRITNPVPLLAGMVKDEGAYFIPNVPNLIDGFDKSQFLNILREFIRYRDVENAPALLDAIQYEYTYWPQPLDKQFIRKKLMEMMGDYMFGAAISETLRLHVQTATVYFYVFEYSSLFNYAPYWRGVTHGQDAEYIFGLPFINHTYMELLDVYPRQFYDYADRNISEFMISLITNFTTMGAPTPRTMNPLGFRNSSWYHFNNENLTYLCINWTSVNREGYRIDEANFWNHYYPRLLGQQSAWSRPIETDPDKTATFELVTWALSAVSGVQLLLIIGLIVCLVRRSRTKKYPKTHLYHSNSREISI